MIGQASKAPIIFVLAYFIKQTVKVPSYFPHSEEAVEAAEEAQRRYISRYEKT